MARNGQVCGYPADMKDFFRDEGAGEDEEEGMFLGVVEGAEGVVDAAEGEEGGERSGLGGGLEDA